MTMLELINVTKKYGGLVAVNDVSFAVKNGELPALIGPNGAGKTTAYNLLTGKTPLTKGRIEFKGEDITGYSPAKRTRLGIGRSFQITSVFDELSVRQNIRAPIIARSDAQRNVFRRIEGYADINAEADRMLELVNLLDFEDTDVKKLSYGDERRVEIGIALATDPSFLLLDEPTAGLNPAETNEMIDLIHQLDEETETTFMITEHDMDVVFTLATRILVLNQGEIIADGSPDEVKQNERVQTAYLGEEVGV